MAQQRRPYLKIIFTAREDMEEFAEGLGELILHPVSMTELVDAANRLLDQTEPKSAA